MARRRPRHGGKKVAWKWLLKTPPSGLVRSGSDWIWADRDATLWSVDRERVGALTRRKYSRVEVAETSLDEFSAKFWIVTLDSLLSQRLTDNTGFIRILCGIKPDIFDILLIFYKLWNFVCLYEIFKWNLFLKLLLYNKQCERLMHSYTPSLNENSRAETKVLEAGSKFDWPK